MSSELLLTVTKAAERVGMSRKTFYNHVLPNVATKWVGGRRYVIAAALDEWVNKDGDAA